MDKAREAELKYREQLLVNLIESRLSEQGKQEGILRRAAEATFPSLTPSPKMMAGLVGFGEGMSDAYEGTMQLAGDTLGHKAMRGVGNVLGLGDSATSEQDVEGRAQLMNELRSDPEYGLTTAVGRGMGFFAEPLSLAVPMAKGKTLRQAAIIGAGFGGGFGALGREDAPGERLWNAGLGAAGGAVLNPAIMGIGRGLRSRAARKENEARMEDLMNRGIYPDSGPANMTDVQAGMARARSGVPRLRRDIPPSPDPGLPAPVQPPLLPAPTRGGDLNRPYVIEARDQNAPSSYEPAFDPATQAARQGDSVQAQMDAMWGQREAVPQATPEQIGRDALDASDPRYLEQLEAADRAKQDAARRQTRDVSYLEKQKLTPEDFDALPQTPDANLGRAIDNAPANRPMEAALKGFKAQAKYVPALPVKQIAKLPHKKLDEVADSIGLELPKRANKQQKAEAIHHAGTKLYSNPFADIELLGGLLKSANEFFYKTGRSGDKFFREHGGEMAWNLLRKNPDAAVGGLIGSSNYDVIADEDAGIMEKILAATVMGAVGAGGVRGIREGIRHNMGEEALESIKRSLGDNYGLPEDYIKSMRAMKAMRSHIGTRFFEVADEIRKLPVAQRKALYNMLNGEQATSADLKALNDKSRALITEMGQTLVDAGMLDPDVFKRNVNTYLHRSYWKHFKDGGKFDSQKAKLAADELRGRGLSKTLKRKGSETDRLLNSGEGWYVDQIASKKLKDKSRIVLRRDYTKEERVKMGEIEDAAYAIAETGKLMANDAAVYKFFDDINTKYGVDPKSITPDEASRRGLAYIPEDKMPGTDVPRYGALSGRLVPQEIHDDIVAFRGISRIDDNLLVKFYDKALVAWKLGKTALNPVVHMNNVMSNLMLYDFSGARWKHLNDARRRLFRKSHKGDDMIAMANEYGVFRSDWVTHELGAITPLQRQIERDLLPDVTLKDNPLDFIAKHAKSGWNLTGGKMIDAYHYEDNVFRLGIFMDRLEKGMSPEDAALEARKWLIDYDINAKGINMLRRTATPFLSYTYRAIPLLAEAFTHRPTKFLKWAALGLAVHGMGGGFSEKGKREKRMMDKRYQGSFFGLPHAQRIGEIDGTGQFLDVTRWIPGGDIFDAQSTMMGVAGLPAPFQPSFGGPIGVAANVGANQDPFTQKDIVTPSDDKWEAIAKKLGYAAKQFIPNNPLIGDFGTGAAPWLNSYSQQKVIDAFRGGETPLGDRLPPWQAAAQVMGVKIRPADMDKLEMRASMGARREINDIKTKMYSIQNDLAKKRLTEEQADEQLEKLQQKAQRVMERLEKKLR